MSDWIDVTDDIPIDVEVGQVLMFDYEGSPLHLKIMRKRNGRVWAEKLKIRLMHPDEVIVKELEHPRIEVVGKPESEQTGS